jgi:hypothetical protein
MNSRDRRRREARKAATDGRSASDTFAEREGRRTARREQKQQLATERVKGGTKGRRRRLIVVNRGSA